MRVVCMCVLKDEPLLLHYRPQMDLWRSNDHDDVINILSSFLSVPLCLSVCLSVYVCLSIILSLVVCVLLRSDVDLSIL